MLANSGRHLLIALIVPDQRAGRNLAAAIGLALHSLMPGIVRLGSLTYVMTAVLCVVLAYELQQIGWSRSAMTFAIRRVRLSRGCWSEDGLGATSGGNGLTGVTEKQRRTDGLTLV